MQDNLGRVHTPEKLVSAIMHGITSWEHHDHPTPLFRGSVRPDDIGLVQAFQDQTVIGWDQLLRGRISKKWGEVFAGCKAVTSTVHSASWSKQVVISIWEYSTSLWKFRNGEVYGHTKD